VGGTEKNPTLGNAAGRGTLFHQSGRVGPSVAPEASTVFSLGAVSSNPEPDGGSWTGACPTITPSRQQISQSETIQPSTLLVRPSSHGDVFDFAHLSNPQSCEMMH
jgi:hypothetical protein